MGIGTSDKSDICICTLKIRMLARKMLESCRVA
jgi:hypothetical protein